ncbi:MAG: hypothetical protein GY865_05480 [candidate division Zixibacteria bacterium]|nr:hypothetical protein [candidate division Zixibacteria bacterium]
MKKILSFLGKYASGKNIVILLFITLAIYSLMLFYTIPNIMIHSDGMELLDMQPTGYSAEYAKSLFENLGEKGREYYLFRQIPVDMLYPLLFAITYSLLLIFLFRRAFSPVSKIHYFSLVPILGGLFDYLENFGIIFMLLIYPEFSNLLAQTTNLFSIFKSGFTTIFFTLLFIALIALFIKRIKRSQ